MLRLRGAVLDTVNSLCVLCALCVFSRRRLGQAVRAQTRQRLLERCAGSWGVGHLKRTTTMPMPRHPGCTLITGTGSAGISTGHRTMVCTGTRLIRTRQAITTGPTSPSTSKYHSSTEEHPFTVVPLSTLCLTRVDGSRTRRRSKLLFNDLSVAVPNNCGEVLLPHTRLVQYDYSRAHVPLRTCIVENTPTRPRAFTARTPTRHVKESFTTFRTNECTDGRGGQPGVR